MYLKGTRKGLRRVAATTRTSVPLFSFISGVVLGGPHTTGGLDESNSNLSKAGVHHVRSHLLRRVPTLESGDFTEPASGLRTWARHSLPDLSLDVASGRCGADIRWPNESICVREVPLRRTKRRQRFNPGRCRDCDLRFSFPQSSRCLPFLSHDARVEMGRSVTKS